MPSFAYTVVDKQGKQNKGSLDADTRDAAMAELKKAGSLVVECKEVGAMGKDVKFTAFDKKPMPRDLAVFCRQFVAILDAGVPAVQALEMLAEQTENKMLANALAECKTTIEQGETLSHAMSQCPKVFPSMLVTLVEAGEASGSLTTSFTRMATQFERTAQLQDTVKKATIYPTILIIMMVCSIAVLLTFVVPTFEDVFAQLNTGMPALTKFTLSVALFFKSKWYVILLIVLAIVFGIKYAQKTPGGRRFFGNMAIHSKIRGRLVVKTASARMARTLGTLLSSGLSLVDALSITADTMDNVFFEDALRQAQTAVTLGAPLSDELKKSGVFPPLVYHMVGIGEETGDIEGMLEKLAEYYEEEVRAETERTLAVMEPVIIVVMAVVIGTIILSIVLPMASMYNSLSNL